MVAYHVKFNDDFYSLEAGTIAIDIIKKRNGRWTYEDRSTRLKRGDKIYYWLHVVYEGLGYNLLNQEYEVKGLLKIKEMILVLFLCKTLTVHFTLSVFRILQLRWNSSGRRYRR